MPDRTVQSPSLSVELTTPTSFLSLPGEVRNQVYALIFDQPRTMHIRPGLRRCTLGLAFIGVDMRTSGWIEPPILRCCRTVRAEASSYYYAVHDFEVALEFNEFTYAASWLAGIIRRCGSNPFHGLNFFVLSPTWEDIASIRPLVHLITLTGFDFKSRALHWSDNIGPWPLDERFPQRQKLISAFHFPYPAGDGPFQEAVEDVVELARQAHRGHWTLETCDADFDLLCRQSVQPQSSLEVSKTGSKCARWRAKKSKAESEHIAESGKTLPSRARSGSLTDFSSRKREKGKWRKPWHRTVDRSQPSAPAYPISSRENRQI